jgi:flagellar hook-basal body complex protein FliE
MLPIGSVNSAFSGLQPDRIGAPLLQPSAMPGDSPSTIKPAGDGFGNMLDGLVSTVNAKQAQSDAITNQVLLGSSDKLHQSVIAMQEASTALSLMVQVRNKLVESYQELMRMQV